MEKEPILLVDDDKGILESSEILLSDEFSILTATTISEAKEKLKSLVIRLVIADLNFEGQEEDGIDLIDFISKEYYRTPFIVLSGDKDTKRVVEAMKRPLIDFVTKDGDHEDILRVAIRKGLEKRKEFDLKKSNCNEFKTKSFRIIRMFKDIDKLLSSGSHAPILINGESGTGKEYVAKYISNFLEKGLVAVNMANIPKETAESELFGHIKGAFTGAMANKTGLLERAHNAVFFLDEIGDCSLDIQAKLLRVVQEKEITPVGSIAPKKINVRFIAATHKNLNDLVASGQFRLDLQQRLNTFIFRLPALRERPEDIEFYATMFVNELTGKSYYRIEPSAFNILKKYHWPGNVRELRNVIERAVVYTNRRTIDDVVVYKSLDIPLNQRMGEPKLKLNYEKMKREELISAIIETMESTNGNKTEAAKILGIDFSTLYRWMKKYDLEDLVPQKKRGRPRTPSFQEVRI